MHRVFQVAGESKRHDGCNIECLNLAKHSIRGGTELAGQIALSRRLYSCHIPSNHFARLVKVKAGRAWVEFARVAVAEIAKEIRLDCRPREEHLIHLGRSEEHTSELQSLRHLVCRILLE